jgi:splicing factor 3A subunit 1
LLSKETDSKIRLEEANRIIRESQHQGAVGPSLPHSAGRSKGPAHHAAPQMDNSLEPAFKRPKTEVTRVEAPPPPPPVKTTVVQAPPGFDQSTVTASVQPFEPFATPVGPPASEPTGQLLSESEFAASLSKPEVILQIRVPNDPTQMAWNFYGQIVSVTVDVMSTVKSIKQDVSKSHFNDMPANKMQLKSKITGAFLKDNLTLAALNIGPTVTLELVPKTRGGRK